MALVAGLEPTSYLINSQVSTPGRLYQNKICTDRNRVTESET
jgi:hypothetical protein